MLNYNIKSFIDKGKDVLAKEAFGNTLKGLGENILTDPKAIAGLGKDMNIDYKDAVAMTANAAVDAGVATETEAAAVAAQALAEGYGVSAQNAALVAKEMAKVAQEAGVVTTNLGTATTNAGKFSALIKGIGGFLATWAPAIIGVGALLAGIAAAKY